MLLSISILHLLKTLECWKNLLKARNCECDGFGGRWNEKNASPLSTSTFLSDCSKYLCYNQLESACTQSLVFSQNSTDTLFILRYRTGLISTLHLSTSATTLFSPCSPKVGLMDACIFHQVSSTLLAYISHKQGVWLGHIIYM